MLLKSEHLYPPHKPFHKAKELSAILQEKPDWFVRISSPLSFARREGGRLNEARLLQLLESDGSRPAFKLDARQASRVWNLGERVEAYTLAKLREDWGSKPVPNVRSASCATTVTLSRFFKQEDPNRRVHDATSLSKILHWPIDQSPLKVKIMLHCAPQAM